MAQIFEKNYLNDFIKPQSEGGWGVGDWVSDTVIVDKRPYSNSEISVAIQASALDQSVKDAFNNPMAVAYLVEVMQTGIWGVSSPREFDKLGVDRVSDYTRPGLPDAYAGEDQTGVTSPASLAANEPDTAQGQAGFWTVMPKSDGAVPGWFLFSDRASNTATLSGDSGVTYELMWHLTEGDGVTIRSSAKVSITFA